MGVPKFYRWISERYPLINQILSDSTLLPEIDNFYLDMNGIIHACTHPNDQDSTSKALTFREMILAIFGYIDRIVTEIVKPKKLLFMAIDGVAPRAKLNQQRARRFRAAQERVEKMMIAKQKGETIDEEDVFDTNAITPGTEFMDKVGRHLRWFIRKKMKEDPIWSNLEVVFSGHDVPGEGEHKIMQYIREARAQPDYPPNLRHCMYGQDADLIMLGLVTHEPHFTLLREVVNFNTRFGAKGVRQAIMKQTKEVSFQLLHISILREYIELDLGIGIDFAVDRERLIDDFVFLTFLVGNDFLPHLPTLDISEHAFDTIFNAYKELLQQSPGYIVENGEIRDFARFEALCSIIGKQEATILKTREDDERSFNSKRRTFASGRGSVPTEEEEEEAEEELQRAYEAAYLESMGVTPGLLEDPEEGVFNDDEGGEFTVVSKRSQSAPARILQRPPAEYLGGGAEETKGDEGNDEEGTGDELDAVVTDSDAFGNTAPSKDYRGHYYFKKFKVIVANTTTDQFLTQLMTDYLKGLVWCLAYYVKGCISWTWYYPYHYGPMLIDMKNLAALNSTISFDIGHPFLPFQQLLACLPSASKQLLPRPYQWLMTSEHSPILKYYPMDFGIDMDGKRNPWEAVVLLDFIDSSFLLDAELNHCRTDQLTIDERRRNAFGTVTSHIFDPTETSTFYSCNPDIGLVDIHQCNTTVSESVPSLLPGAFFRPQLVPGTLTAVAGFPTLTAIAMNDVNTDFTKVNVFGSASKYRSLVMTVHSPIKSTADASKLSLLIGKSVFVNYPQLHEARIVAVTTEKEEIREVKNEDGSVQVCTYPFDVFTAKKWRSESSEMEKQYLTGRGVPGSGGLDIGEIFIRLRLLPLQGMARDHKTGAKYKVFGKTEADVPAQLVLWSSIVEDPRFQEVGELPVPKLFPVGCEVVCITGDMVGSKGVIVGPHSAEESGKVSRAQSGASNVSRQTSASSTTSATSTGSKKSKQGERVVDIEYTVNPPEPSFGYAIAASVQDQYFPSREICTVLKLSPSLLGKIVGSLFVEPFRADIGLNLKRNGQYQLLGYVRRVDPATVRGTIEFSPESKGETGYKAWGSGDTVQIVGSLAASAATAKPGANSEVGHTAHTDSWEYSAAAVALIVEYQDRFPVLFNNLLRLPQGSPRYSVTELFGTQGSEKNLEEVMEWMKSRPYFNMPRTPLTTISMSKDAMHAVERAVDVRNSYLANAGPPRKVIVKSVPCTNVFRGDLSSPFDAPLQLNATAPRLGDRVVNLNSTGVPCGLKGTVVCIHGSTGFVEVSEPVLLRFDVL
jgi:5'-3' exoribonuclease 1